MAERRVESARTILKHCKIELEQRAAALAAQPVPAAPPTPSAGQVLESALETAIAEWSDATTPLDEGVYEDGLLRAFQIEARAGTRVIAAPERDIDLVLERPAGRVAVSLCNASNMVSLAGRLRRLVALADQGRYQRIVWLRDQRLALKPTARAVHDYAGQLRERGCGVVAAPAEAYAALAAIRALLADAAAGDLQAGERPIAVAELSTWLAQRLPVPVRDLLDAIGGAESTVEIAGLDALHELLQGECLLELADAAARSGVPAAVAREAALLRPEVIGYLAGPPEVLFLQPGGLVRS